MVQVGGDLNNDNNLTPWAEALQSTLLDNCSEELGSQLRHVMMIETVSIELYHPLQLFIQRRNRERVAELNINPKLKHYVLVAIDLVIEYHTTKRTQADSAAWEIEAADAAEAAEAAAEAVAWAGAWLDAVEAREAAKATSVSAMLSTETSTRSAAESVAWAVAGAEAAEAEYDAIAAELIRLIKETE